MIEYNHSHDFNRRSLPPNEATLLCIESFLARHRSREDLRFKLKFESEALIFSRLGKRSRIALLLPELSRDTRFVIGSADFTEERAFNAPR